MNSRRRAVVFPRQQRILEQLGENIELALKRRHISQELLHQRTGISKPTLRRIIRGDSTVSIGHYMIVLSVLGLENDLGMVASDRVLIGKLESIAKLKSKIHET
ncbi:helix-turn-helix domain-containing protein [Vibrio mexicanus]|uniref:helix-turn-helix domain-containing protein n=1 Tax=Vibrio mexicanus TaxID=1004326 RepID=UPI00063CE885|nr:helix-turn-helix transcriptional regulator [Vibrio mexicanus]